MQYKSYKNLIIIISLVVIVAGVIAVLNLNFEEMLLKIGVYDKSLTILNTADVHGQILYDDPAAEYLIPEKNEVVMGLPLIAKLVTEVKADRTEALMFDCGDIFHGTNEANINGGESIVKIINQMPYTAMVPGNHDFNYGIERLKQIRDELKFPVLSSNVYQNGKLIFKDYMIMEIRNIRVGIFGLTSQDALSNANYLGSTNLEIKDPVAEAGRVMKILREKADIVILLSHQGMEHDFTIVDSVRGIDLILSGHYHLLSDKARFYKGTFLAEAGDFTHRLGIAEMYLKKGALKKVKWKTTFSKKKDSVPAALAAIAEEYHRIALKDSDVIIGKSTVFLDGIRSHVRTGETNLGDLLADAMRKESGAQIVLMNGGGIRASINSGVIDLYKIGGVLPFINSMVTVEMSGKDVLEALEQGLMRYVLGSANGGFPQVSGIKYSIDGTKPAGNRILNVTLENGEPLEMEEQYQVATNDYLYNGGDGYKVFKRSKLLKFGRLLKDVLISYVAEKKTIDIQTDNRITFIKKRY